MTDRGAYRGAGQNADRDAAAGPGPGAGPGAGTGAVPGAGAPAADPVRRAVRAALEDAGLTLKQASQALGRNDAYLQQFLYRGSPRRLPEAVRLRLAALTGVDGDRFLDRDLRALRGGSASSGIAVPLFEVSAAAGGGRTGEEPDSSTALSFPPALLRQITAAPANGLRLISISGDSMAPTLEHGDMVMMDTNRMVPSPPGIFILDDGVGLVAKRVDAVPNTRPQMLRMSSDNPAYSNYQRGIDEVRILGRVVWFARSL